MTDMNITGKSVILGKSEIYKYLADRKVWHEITEHEPVYNMEEASAAELPYPEGNAKNLFVRDDKKRNYYLLTVRGDRRVNLKEFRQKHGTRPLSFASGEDLMEILGLIPGAVTPLGLLNDEERRVKLFIDRELAEGSAITGVHPNDNTATVWLRTEDLIRIIEEHGNEVQLTEI